jgi:hypothetical protein
MSIQAIQARAPAYLTSMKDLNAAHNAENFACACSSPDGLLELWHKHRHERETLRKQHRYALSQQHRYAREQAKAEKAFLAKSKLEPSFWVLYPNHDGRRDTMMARLQWYDHPNHVTDLMPVYAEWLLTAKKTHKNGRPMNRWALMTAFAAQGGY